MQLPTATRSTTPATSTPWLGLEVIHQGAVLHERGAIPDVRNPREVIAYCAASIARYADEHEYLVEELALLEARAARLRAFGFLKRAQSYDEARSRLSRRAEVCAKLIQQVGEKLDAWWSEHADPAQPSDASREVT